MDSAMSSILKASVCPDINSFLPLAPNADAHAVCREAQLTSVRPFRLRRARGRNPSGWPGPPHESNTENDSSSA